MDAEMRHAQAAAAARRGHPNLCARCRTPLRDREQPRSVPRLEDVADALRRCDMRQRGHDPERALKFGDLNRPEQDYWLAQAQTATKALEG